MAKGNLPGPMGDLMKDNITRIKSKGKGFTLGLMDDVMMENGRTASNMAKVNIQTLKARLKQVFGKMVKSSSGVKNFQ